MLTMASSVIRTGTLSSRFHRLWVKLPAHIAFPVVNHPSFAPERDFPAALDLIQRLVVQEGRGTSVLATEKDREGVSWQG